MRPELRAKLPQAGRPFQVISDYQPAGDQPTAIDALARRISSGESDVVLLGATGTGKSATSAWLIEKITKANIGLGAE